jgi:hypothetical protein
MFDANLDQTRFLWFEGAVAVSTWTLMLPKQFRTFDYITISDVILHMKYTAREARRSARLPGYQGVGGGVRYSGLLHLGFGSLIVVIGDLFLNEGSD